MFFPMIRRLNWLSFYFAWEIIFGWKFDETLFIKQCKTDSQWELTDATYESFFVLTHEKLQFWLENIN